MKTHLNLRASDLQRSIAFYEILLDAKPAKQYSDYALFLTEQPGLELAWDRDPAVCLGESAHYGIAVESTQALDHAIVRLRDEEPAERDNDATACCANVRELDAACCPALVNVAQPKVSGQRCCWLL